MKKRSRIWEPTLEIILENDIMYPQNSRGKEEGSPTIRELRSDFPPLARPIPGEVPYPPTSQVF
jgi:hypothetical protein